MTTEVPKHASLVAALAAAQGEFANIPKTEKVSAGARQYRYADLAGVLAAVRPVLSRHGIALLQTLEPNHEGLLLHTSLRGYGESIESTMPIVAPLNNPQAIGSGLTYMRRYSLCALVGVAADDDDDDGQEAGKRPPPGQRIAPDADLRRPHVSRETPREKPVVPPDDAWLAAAKLKVEHAEPPELAAWWNSPEQKQQRHDLHRRRADFAEPLAELKARVLERCKPPENGGSLEIVPAMKGSAPDWQRWQAEMARAIDAAPTVAKLEQLWSDNRPHLDGLAADVPRASEALSHKLGNARFILADNEAPIDLGGQP